MFSLVDVFVSIGGKHAASNTDCKLCFVKFQNLPKLYVLLFQRAMDPSLSLRGKRAGQHPGGGHQSITGHRSPETIFCCRSEAQEGKDGVRRELKRKND